MDVLNMNTFAVHPRIISSDGKVDSINVMAKRRVTIPDGYKVDLNWVTSTEMVSVFESKTSRTPINLATLPGSGASGVANVAVSGKTK